ncbi:MAG: hypothetical protein Fur0010_16490 [Bdellovibrio sp.]
MGIGELLAKFQSALGHPTAKAFFIDLQKSGLECNYQYFSKVRKGMVFPSSAIINQIAKAIPKEMGEKLIFQFCAQQFESFSYLFQNEKINKQTQMKLDVFQGQKTLSLKQIAELSKDKNNYFLFLMLTLSRRAILVEELTSLENQDRAIEALVKAQICHRDDRTISATSTEFRFPKDDSNALKEAYKKFDLWDKEFSEQFSFETLVNKMMIRRISPRYLGIIQKNAELLFDFVRASDEADKRYNQDVIHLNFVLKKGELPG